MGPEKGYVYTLQGGPEVLQAWLKMLGQPLYHWVADEGGLKMAAGEPSAWKDQGAAFGPRGELRWWREGEIFRAFLLADDPVEDLAPLPGEWHTTVQEFDLQNLHEPRVQPSFAEYPHGSHRGRLVARIFHRDGTPLFISPRELKEGED